MMSRLPDNNPKGSDRSTGKVRRYAFMCAFCDSEAVWEVHQPKPTEYQMECTLCDKCKEYIRKLAPLIEEGAYPQGEGLYDNC